jgi:hypothetical protein
MQESPVHLQSIRGGSNANQDCGILIAQEFLRLNGTHISYDQIVAHIDGVSLEFTGEHYDPKAQLPHEMFINTITAFAPGRFEIFQVIHKPKMIRAANCEVIGEPNKPLLPHRLCLISSWDPKANGGRGYAGAGHYTILESKLKNSQEVIDALIKIDFTENILN